MADLSRTIEIVFAGVDRTGATLTAVGTGLDGLAAKTRDMTAPAASVTKALIAMDAAATGLAVAVGTKAVQETVKFKDSLYLVAKQLGDQGPGMDAATSQIEAIGLQYGKNANLVAASAAGFLAAGYDYRNSVGLVDTATQFMIAGELDAATSTDALTRSLSGFRIPADQAAEGGRKVGDVLNKIGDISAGSFAEIVQGFARIAPTAKDAGLSMEETAASIAVIVAKFGSGEIAATALKSGFLALLDPSKEAKGELDRLGVAATDATGKLRAGKDIMADLQVATAGLTESERLQTAAIVFGKDQAGAMNALLGDWGTRQKYVADMMDKTTGAVGSMQREVDGKLRLLSTVADQTQEAWRQMLEHLGRQIVTGDDLGNLTRAVGTLGTALKTALDAGALEPLFGPLRKRFGDLGEYVDGMAKALPAAFQGIDWRPVLDALGGVESGVRGLFRGLDLTKPEDLREVLQSLVDGAGSFIRVTQGIYEGLAPICTVLGTIAKAFSELSPELQSAAGYFLGVSTAINLVSGPIETIGTAVKALGGTWTAAAAMMRSSGLLTLLGDAGLVAAAGAGGYAVGTVLNDGISKLIDTTTGQKGATLGSWLYDLVSGNKDLAITAPATADALRQYHEQLPKIAEGAESAEAQVTRLSAAERNQLMGAQDLTAQFNLLSGGAIDASGTVRKLADQVVTATDGVTKFVEVDGQWVRQTTDLIDAQKGRTDGVSNLVYWHGRLQELSPALQDAMTKEADATKKSKDELEKKAQETERMNRASVEFMTNWAKIQSEKEVKLFEVKSKIDIAQIEADAKRTVAAFSAMSEQFKSTETVLTSLFNLWGGLQSRGEKNRVSEWIDREYAVRERLAESQTKLIDAEIKRMEAQTEMLQRGGTELRISSDGLEPALEAFMFAVIDKVRVQVSGSYQDFLVGCGAS